MVSAVIFDLGGTLVDWPDWEEAVERWWVLSYDHLVAARPDVAWPEREEYVRAMRAAEAEHWRRVDEEQWSRAATVLVEDGFACMGLRPAQDVLLAALDGYAKAVEGEAVAFPEAHDMLCDFGRRATAWGCSRTPGGQPSGTTRTWPPKVSPICSTTSATPRICPTLSCTLPCFWRAPLALGYGPRSA
jgi:hypothetical protein